MNIKITIEEFNEKEDFYELAVKYGFPIEIEEVEYDK